MALPRYVQPSTMPEQVAVALRPPKSVAAVPDISEVRPTDAITTSTQHKPRKTGAENKYAAIRMVSPMTSAESMAAGGARRLWNKLSETQPPKNPPTMPKRHSSRPQCFRKNSAPGCFTSAAKIKYQFWMPLRKMPEVRPMSAMSSMSLLAKTFFSRSIVERSTCIWPDEASWVSKAGNFASSGVSLMSHKSMNTQKIMIAAGMKNTDQVASTSLPPTVTLVAKVFWSASWNQPPVELAFVSSMIFCPQSNAK